MSKYKVVDFEYEIAHRFELGEIVEPTGVLDKESGHLYYKNKDGLVQILIGSEVEVLED